MTKKTIDELSPLTHMTLDMVIAIFVLIDYEAIIKGTKMPLSEISPTSIWQTLSQGQKGYVGQVFYDLHKDLGFEYAGKDNNGTTNLYRLIKHVDL